MIRNVALPFLLGASALLGFAIPIKAGPQIPPSFIPLVQALRQAGYQFRFETPPIAGAKIKSIFLKFLLIFKAKDLHIFSAKCG